MDVYNLLSIWDLYVAADQGDSSVSVSIFDSTKYITTPFVSVAIRGYPSVNSFWQCFDSRVQYWDSSGEPSPHYLEARLVYLTTPRRLDNNTNKYKQ